VVRSHEHVAGAGIGGDDSRDRSALDVPREQEPAARRLHGQHEARLVVTARTGGRVAASRPAAGRRMQAADPAERIERERLAGLHRPHGDARGAGPPQQFADRP